MSQIKDSEGKTYGANVLDMLAKRYNFMVREKMPFTPVAAFRADHILSTCGGANQKVADKFIKELEFVKEVAKNQPVAIVTYTRRFWSDTENVWVDLGGKETETFKSFEFFKMRNFVSEWENKDRSYVIVNVEKINQEYLLESK